MNTGRPPSLARSLASKASAGLGVVLTLTAGLVCVAMLLPPLLGYQRYVVNGGSMSPAIPRGSLVYDEEVTVASLRRGDVITYVPPGGKRPVTHRIVGIRPAEGGRRSFQTKGDANARPDARWVNLSRPVQAKASFHVPLIGWPLIAAGDREARMALLGLPAMLVLLSAMRSLWREAGRIAEARERPEGAGG